MVAKKPTGTLMRAITSGAWQDPKTMESYSVRQGELIRSNHPVVKAVPAWFEDAESFDRPEVEQATAAPGEKRGA
jgi:hypothetical protein